MANETGLDFTEQIITLENKYRQVKNAVIGWFSIYFIKGDSLYQI